MCAHSSNSSDPFDSGKVRAPADAELDSARQASSPSGFRKPLETFEFEVSAGRSTQADAIDLARPPTPQPLSEPPASTRVVQKSNRFVPLDVSEEPTDAPMEPVLIAAPVKRSFAQAAPLAVAARPARPASAAARHSSWWITSLGIHVLLLLALAFSTLAVIREEKLELYASTVAYEPLEDFQDLEIDPTEDLESLDEALDEPDADTLAELSTESLLEEPTLTETPVGETAATEVSTLGDVSNLLGDVGLGLTGADDAIGAGSRGGMVKFFGTEIKARRILYMLDNSGGMNSGGKFEALVAELQASVAALDPKQKFYVVFYSDTVYPLFFPQSVFEFVRPTERNQRQLSNWLDTVELCYGNAIDEALAAAETIRPEVVFLLTDGDLFTKQSKKTLLLNPVGRRYAIHTFGLGVKEQSKTAQNLQLVADANGGTFRTIKVSDEMKTQAEENQRVYNRSQPGLVWGPKVSFK